MVRKGGGLSWQKQMRQLILRRNIRSGRSETAEKWKGKNTGVKQGVIAVLLLKLMSNRNRRNVEMKKLPPL